MKYGIAKPTFPKMNGLTEGQKSLKSGSEKGT